MSKKYKLALMGAHGVGKTVFLGSYFYITTQRGEGNVSVSIIKQHSVDVIGKIISKIFQEHSVVEGTVERIDLSFDVPKLGMDVEFFDVPGGHTQDMDQWAEQKFFQTYKRQMACFSFLRKTPGITRANL